MVATAVTCLLQDSKGYLWIGTQHGVSRFDGIRFENFSFKDGLPDDFITDIYEDKNGGTWIANRGGVSRYRNGVFETYTARDGLPDNNVRAIVEDGKGRLWFGTYSGAAMFDGAAFTAYGEAEGFPTGKIMDIAADGDGRPWFAVPKGVGRLENNRLIMLENNLIKGPVTVLKPARDGSLWVGSQDGLYRYRRGVVTGYSTADGLTHPQVRTICETGGGDLWIGTNNGVNHFTNGTLTGYHSRHGFLGDWFNAILKDREGNIWFGADSGLSKLVSRRIDNFSVKDGLADNQVWSVLQDGAGDYWFGTDKGLSRYSSGVFKNYTTQDGLVNDAVYALTNDAEGNLWVGTHGGVSVLSPATETFRNYTTADGLPADMVISLARDKNGGIWIGTVKGLRRAVNGVITRPAFERESSSANIILTDRAGDLWFPNRMGLWKVTGGEAVLRIPVDKLPHHRVLSLLEDHTGKLWVGTPQGLRCFSGDTFVTYTTDDGLPNAICYFLLEDDAGNIWIGTGRGISRFDGESFKNYTTRDGLISYEMSERACLKDRAGYLWFGAAKGVTRFIPPPGRTNRVPPPVYINHFKVFERDYSLGGGIRLKHNENHIEVGFVGLSFASPESVKYRYRLNGIDSVRFETANRSIAYPYLPPGDYRFEVTAVNNDGVESTAPASIEFRILPPFWRTWWFRLMAGLALLSMTGMFLLWRIKRAQEKTAARERENQLVTAQKMELLGILAAGAVHDLKNLLSIILGYSKIAVRHADGEDDRLKPLERIKSTTGTAIQVVKQILTFTRREYDRAAAVNLPDLLDNILDTLRISTPGNIKILWEPSGEEITIHINPAKFQQVVMNLCLNAVHAMEETGGELHVRLYKKPADRVILEVADTGAGMAPDTLAKIFTPLFTTKESGKGTGLGLFVVNRIVSEFNGGIDVRSQPGEGTTFTLSFPAAP